ncbi:MAG: CRISPR-associated endonuclease Cas2 [Gammaproteobacteria bacterium]|nr:CRISPR-associated endonuclease Cas2 [Gammaproteobacteria bacterium]
MDVLVTYDIADTERTGAPRLRRIADVCEKYGQRVQFSVFECRLSGTRLARMVGEIRDTIDYDVDSVIIYRFPGDMEDATLRLGRDGSHTLGKPWLL